MDYLRENPMRADVSLHHAEVPPKGLPLIIVWMDERKRC